MSKSSLLQKLAVQSGLPWIITVVAVVVGFIVIGVAVDVRWIILALMTIFIVTPMLMALLYFSYGLLPENCLNVLPHRLELTEEGIMVKVYIEESGDQSSYYQPQLKEQYSRIFLYSQFKPYQVWGTGIAIPLKTEQRGKGGFVWVDAAAFPPGEMDKFVEALIKGMREKKQNK